MYVASLYNIFIEKSIKFNEFLKSGHETDL